ncbi:Developmental regulator flbA [Diplodia seriata]|uniref:Developmental regulator flbA n=1 Tax=Diplodia seriata TaxID=420778 RepID=A0A1S8BBH8_9PEZI|nr:Developmental regulator flbA [Diplodia seriata]
MRCLTIIIRHSFLRSVFGQFLAETGDDGTLTAYLAINEFSNGYQEAKTENEPLKLDIIRQMLADARQLYRAYFSPHSPRVMNVIYHLQERLMVCFARKRDDEETLNKVATLFDQAQDSIFKRMTSSFVPIFMRESKYASFVRLQEKQETREPMTGSGAHSDSSAQSAAKYCYEDDQIRTRSKDNFLIDRGTEMMQTPPTVDRPPVMTGTQSIGYTGSTPEEDKPSPSPEPAAPGGSLDDPGHETGAHAIKVDEDLISSMAKKEVVNRLMRTFYELFGEELEDSCESESGEDKSDVGSVSTESSEESGILTPSETSEDLEDTNSSENTRGHQQTGSNLDPTSVSQKRKSQNDRRSNGSFRRLDEEDEDEHDDSKRPRRAVGKRPVETTLRRFACPFSKRYPGLRPKCSACVYPGFKTTHRVKEHLYRTHMRPVRILCPRCYTPFENDASLREHVLAVERCPQAESPPVEAGLDEEQGRLLR